MYQWLSCYLLKASYEKYESNLKKGMDAFTAKNESQVYYARNLSVAYIQVFKIIILKICDNILFYLALRITCNV